MSRCSVKMMIFSPVHQRVVGEQVAELGPLLIGAAVPYPARDLYQVGEDGEFLVEFGDRARCGSSVGYLGFDLLGLAARYVIDLILICQVLAEHLAEPSGQVAVLRRGLAVAHLLAPLLQALVASFQ